MMVHNDPPEKLSTRSYERFLVNSPLQVNIARTAFNYFFSSLSINTLQTNNTRNTLKTKLVAVSAAEGSNVNLSFNLFCKYEHSIHESNENEFTEFVQFLVTSPLKVSLISSFLFD